MIGQRADQNDGVVHVGDGGIFENGRPGHVSDIKFHGHVEVGKSAAGDAVREIEIKSRGFAVEKSAVGHLDVAVHERRDALDHFTAPMGERAINELFEGVKRRRADVHDGIVGHVRTGAVVGAGRAAIVKCLPALVHAAVEGEVFENQRRIVPDGAEAFEHPAAMHPRSF